MRLALDEEVDVACRPEHQWPAAAAEGEDLALFPGEVADREAVVVPGAAPRVVKHH